MENSRQFGGRRKEDLKQQMDLQDERGRKKERLGVKGFEQIYGIDYEETFSPVVNNASLRILFALAVKKNYIQY